MQQGLKIYWKVRFDTINGSWRSQRSLMRLGFRLEGLAVIKIICVTSRIGQMAQGGSGACSRQSKVALYVRGRCGYHVGNGLWPTTLPREEADFV